MHLDHDASCLDRRRHHERTNGATCESGASGETREKRNGLAWVDVSSFHRHRRHVHARDRAPSPSPFVVYVSPLALRQSLLPCDDGASLPSPRASLQAFRIGRSVSFGRHVLRLLLPRRRGACGDGLLCGGHDHDGHLPGHLQALMLSYQTPFRFW